MRGLVRRALDALDALDARNTAKIAAEGWDYHVPTICQDWLHDKRRVLWLKERLATAGPVDSDASHDQQIGQIFCNVIERWGEDLVDQGEPEPQAIMTNKDLTPWRTAMQKYPWGPQE
jgi:hypothetical protein